MVGNWNRTIRRVVPVALSANLLLGCNIHFNNFHARASRTEVTAYPFTPGGRVELAAFNGRVEVIKNDAPEVRIQCVTTCRAPTDEEAVAGLDLILPEAVSEASSLSFKVHDPRSPSHRYSVELKAEVPGEAHLILRSSNGRISVEEVRGDLDARTSNGSIVARDGGAEEVHLETSNGKVTAERLSGTIVIRTSNGGVQVHECPGALDVTTSNGGVEIEVPAGAEADIAAESSNGTVRCTLPGAFSGTVDARTSNGKIHCGYPITLVPGTIGSGRLKGTIGEGGPGLRVKTSNGSIHIEPAGG